MTGGSTHRDTPEQLAGHYPSVILAAEGAKPQKYPMPKICPVLDVTEDLLTAAVEAPTVRLLLSYADQSGFSRFGLAGHLAQCEECRFGQFSSP